MPFLMELPTTDGQISTSTGVGVGVGEFWEWLDKTTISWMDKSALSGVIQKNRNMRKKKKKSKGRRKRNTLPMVSDVIFCEDDACVEFPFSQRRMPPDVIFCEDDACAELPPDVIFCEDDACAELPPDVIFCEDDACEELPPDVIFCEDDACAELMPPDVIFCEDDACAELMPPDVIFCEDLNSLTHLLAASFRQDHDEYYYLNMPTPALKAIMKEEEVDEYYYLNMPTPALKAIMKEEEEYDYRNWAKIPTPALTVIFHKLGAAEVLRSAQAVCSSWWHLALDHSAPLWRCFDMRCIPDYVLFGFHHEKLAEAAVDRSDGLLEHLHVMHISDHFLTYVAGSTPALRSCSLIWSFDLSPKLLLNFFSHCPLLEDLRVYSCFFSPETYGEIGRTCTQLKRLSVEGTQNSDLDLDDEYEYRFHKKSLKFKDDCSEPGSSTEVDSDDPEIQSESDSDNELSTTDWLAFKIADTMPQLRDLQLIRNLGLTNKGLHAILDKCLRLESLDIRCCFNVRVDDALQTKLDNIKSVLISRSSRLSYRAGK